MVYGYASTEAVDSQGEIVDKAAIEAALPDYMRFGNIREMHTLSAVGKTQSANVDTKGLFIQAKIVDKDAWEKVKEGVYNGFSIGGRKLASVGNRIKRLTLSEISIVDRPANPEAVFTMVKFDNLKKGDMDGEVMVGKPMSEKDKAKEQEMRNMFDASYILSMAKELAYLYSSYKAQNRNTKSIESAIKNLKDCARESLDHKSNKALGKLFDAITKSGTVQTNPAPVWTSDWEAGYYDRMRKVLG